MKQADLNRAVALATGESMATVKRLGFLLAGPDEAIDPTAEESGPYVIDWDELETNRLLSNCLRGPQCTIEFAVSSAANDARRSYQGTTWCERKYTPQETTSQTTDCHINNQCIFKRNSNKNGKTFMKLLLINNDGGGFADYIEVPAGTTVAQLFEQKMGDAVARDYLIRVNRQPCPPNQRLQDGDRISITPTKIEGA